ncbi:hypothetical protein AUP74_00417 [Microbulbifer aggregans]|uniref:Uncharacterized protein n=1 Tax=Microbulbifer aggregans TaxID=1769779 RepID=A0A1C9W403_9GAMM|nr:hypothetical protein AUP74_00417 [Microbulbifer aggregans]
MYPGIDYLMGNPGRLAAVATQMKNTGVAHTSTQARQELLVTWKRLHRSID